MFGNLKGLDLTLSGASAWNRAGSGSESERQQGTQNSGHLQHMLVQKHASVAFNVPFFKTFNTLRCVALDVVACFWVGR